MNEDKFYDENRGLITVCTWIMIAGAAVFFISLIVSMFGATKWITMGIGIIMMWLPFRFLVSRYRASPEDRIKDILKVKDYQNN